MARTPPTGSIIDRVATFLTAPTTCAADPDLLIGFETAHGTLDETFAPHALGVVTALNAFVAGAGDHAPSVERVEGWTSPLADVRAQAAHLASWTAGVGRAFRDHGLDDDGDGIYIASTSDFLPLGRAELEEHRIWLRDELASLHERVANGEEIPASEIAQLLALGRATIDASADPEAEGRFLLGPMGPGDVETAMSILYDDARDADSPDDPAIVGLGDLGYVVSAGLEDQPERAERWLDHLAPTTPFGLSPEQAEALGLLGAGNLPGTSTAGAALAARLTTAPKTPVLGPIHRIYGITDPLAPVMVTAATISDGRFPQAPLANAIVSNAVRKDDTMLRMFGDETSQTLDIARRDILAASVAPELDDEARVRLAYDLAEHYARAADGTLTPILDAPQAALYSPNVTEGFGLTTEPLLANWRTGPDGRIVFDSESGDGWLPDEPLRDALGELGNTEGGARGVSLALQGATTERLASNLEPTQQWSPGPEEHTSPVAHTTLTEVSNMYSAAASEIGRERLTTVIDHLEAKPNGWETAALPTVLGVAGEFPGGSTAAGIIQSVEITTTSVDVSGTGTPLDGAQLALNRDLLSLNLRANLSLATPELEAEIAAARESDDPMALWTLTHNDDPGTGSVSPEMETLRDLIHAQEFTADLQDAVDIENSTRPDNDDN